MLAFIRGSTVSTVLVSLYCTCEAQVPNGGTGEPPMTGVVVPCTVGAVQLVTTRFLWRVVEWPTQFFYKTISMQLD